MKPVRLLLVCLLMATAATAQKAKIQSAIEYMKDNDIANARKYIDEVVQNEATKANAKAWLLRAVIYQAIATPKEFMPQLNFILNDNPYMIDLGTANALKNAAPNAFNEAIESYKKALSLDPKYSKDELYPLLVTLAAYAYNEGIVLMNAGKFNDAAESFTNVIDLANLDSGKPWKGQTRSDTVFANSRLYLANSYYQANKEDEALPLLEESIRNPITTNADAYIMVTDIYERKNNEAKWLETMKAAKAKYPNEKRILNNEINYYLKSGKGEESIAKLKEGIAAEPGKSDLYIILGQTYYNMANPRDKSDKPLAKAANWVELEQNAISNYTKAMELDPKNSSVQFYTGIVYYNHAKDMTDEMNKADDKRYKELEPRRNEQLEKSIPYLLKAKKLIEDEGVNESNKVMYKQVLSGLAQAYMITDKPDESTKMQNLLNGVK